MESSWNSETGKYDFSFTPRELGTIRFALVVARYETRDPDVLSVQREFADALGFKEQNCKACEHSRRHHSREGCVHNGMCDKGCKVKYTDKEKFE